MKIFNKLLIVFFCLILFSSVLVGKMVVRAGDRSEPITLDPAEAWDSSSTIHISNIFDRLVVLDPKTLKVKPSLALSWSSNGKGTVWIFRLRRGVKFHDGTRLNADAVVFTFKRQMEGIYKYGEFILFKEIFPFIKDVVKKGEYEVKFILKEPFFQFPSALSVECASIVSPTAVKKMKDSFRFHPVGSGPFKMKEWEKGKKLVIESYKDYWKGSPGLDSYILIVEPNVDKLIDMFRKQKLDIIYSYSISKLVILDGYDWVRKSMSTSLSITFIAFNMKNKYLKRVRVRKALNFLWNRKIIKLVFQNYVNPLCSLFPKGILGYDCNMDKYPMSVKKAKSLLRKEGLQGGFPLTFLVRKGSDLLLRIADLFSKNLRKVGISVKIVNVDYKQYAKMVKEGKYDLTFSGWIADYPDPFNIVNPMFSQKILEGGLANFSMGDNKDIVKMIYKSKTIKDPEKREKYYMKLNEIIVERALLIPLYQDINLLLYNKRIGNLKKNHFGRIDLFRLGKQ